MNTVAPTNACGLCHISLDNISVTRGQSKLLDDVNVELHCGELTSLVGINGAGKTTLLRSLLGEISHEGSVSYNSCDGSKIPHAQITIGYVPQYLDFDRSTPMSVRDFLRAGQFPHPVWLKSRKAEKEKMDALLEHSGITVLSDKTLGTLSGGELQRVMLAQAIHPTPDLLILDEPVAGIDTVGSEQFYKVIAQLQKEYHMAIVMVSHDLRLVEAHADKVVLLNRRVLKEGTPNDVFSSAEFKKQFGGSFHGSTL